MTSRTIIPVMLAEKIAKDNNTDMTVEDINYQQPLEDCQQLRIRIGAAARWFANLEFVPEVGNEDYIVYEVALEDTLAGAADGFKYKPGVCEMISHSEDSYKCGRCHFEEQIIAQ
jgi:hypothetical protein